MSTTFRPEDIQFLEHFQLITGRRAAACREEGVDVQTDELSLSEIVLHANTWHSLFFWLLRRLATIENRCPPVPLSWSLGTFEPPRTADVLYEMDTLRSIRKDLDHLKSIKESFNEGFRKHVLQHVLTHCLLFYVDDTHDALSIDRNIDALFPPGRSSYCVDAEESREEEAVEVAGTLDERPRRYEIRIRSIPRRQRDRARARARALLRSPPPPRSAVATLLLALSNALHHTYEDEKKRRGGMKAEKDLFALPWMLQKRLRSSHHLGHGSSVHCTTAASSYVARSGSPEMNALILRNVLYVTPFSSPPPSPPEELQWMLSPEKEQIAIEIGLYSPDLRLWRGLPAGYWDDVSMGHAKVPVAAQGNYQRVDIVLHSSLEGPREVRRVEPRAGTLASLPIDLQEAVLEYVPPRHMRTLSLVCVAWHRLVYRSPSRLFYYLNASMAATQAYLRFFNRPWGTRYVQTTSLTTFQRQYFLQLEPAVEVVQRVWVRLSQDAFLQGSLRRRRPESGEKRRQNVSPGAMMEMDEFVDHLLRDYAPHTPPHDALRLILDALESNLKWIAFANIHQPPSTVPLSESFTVMEGASESRPNDSVASSTWSASLVMGSLRQQYLLWSLLGAAAYERRPRHNDILLLLWRDWCVVQKVYDRYCCSQPREQNVV